MSGYIYVICRCEYPVHMNKIELFFSPIQQLSPKFIKKYKLFFTGMRYNKNPSTTPCGGNFMASVSFTPKLLFYIYIFCKKKMQTKIKNPIFNFFWHSFPVTEDFLQFCFHRKMLSIKVYENFGKGSLRARSFVFF